MVDAKRNQLWPEDPNADELLPLSKDDPSIKGFKGVHLAVPNAVRGLVNNLHDFVTAPGNALQGKLSPSDALALAPKIGQMAMMDSPLGLAEGAGAGAGNDLVHNMFAGIRAKTANMPKLSQALTMEGRKASPGEIWNSTGWFRGPDQKWRFEIPDQAAALGKTPGTTGSVPLSGMVQHPELYSAYPQLKNMPVSRMQDTGAGIYYPSDKSIGLGQDIPSSMLSTGLHETQHAVQDIEGFARGGSPDDFLTSDHHNRQFMQDQNWDKLQSAASAHGVDPDAVMTGMQRFAQQRPLGDSAYDVKLLGQQDPSLLEAFRQHYNSGAVLSAEKNSAYENYLNLAGEAEARNVQERHAMGYGAETPPWQTPGLPEASKQIVLMPDESVAAGLIPVNHDPFNPPALSPVEHDPWLHTAEPVSHDPFETKTTGATDAK